MPDLKDEYMTTKQVAELLHVTRKTIWKMSNDGRLKATKVGNRNIYKTEEVRAFLESCEQR